MASAGNSGSLTMSAVQVGRHSQLFNFQWLARSDAGSLFLLFTYSSSRILRTVAQRTQHMLEYLTGLHLVGIGQAFP